MYIIGDQGQFLLDEQRMALYRADLGQQINLSRTATKILLVLLQAPNTAVSVDTLKEAVYPERKSPDVASDPIRMHVHQIRRALGASDAVVVERGAGYKFLWPVRQQHLVGTDRTLRVFLSYSSLDKSAVRGLYRRLKADGFTPWLDEEELLPGQKWVEQIRAAVRACDVIIICLGGKTISREGFLQREIGLALEMSQEKPHNETFIIPVRLDERVEVPERLHQWQWADLYQEGGYARLEKALRARAAAIGIAVSARPVVGAEQSERDSRDGATGAWDRSLLTRGGSQPINEAKLILVGRGGVGKTSIVNRLVRNRFDPNEKKTDGIRITRWHVRVGAEDDAIQLNIWDFGGQEIMHSTHQFFLTERSLYLLVLTGREGGEDADVEYWLQLIQSFGGDSPVIVVLNKVREQPFDLNRRSLRQRFPGIIVSVR